MTNQDYIKQGDCLELMREIPSGSVDMVLCDLPYGITECAWDCVIPFELLWLQYKRLIKPNGVICLFGSEPFSTFLRMSNIDWYKYDWVWIKSNGRCSGFVHAKNMPLKKHELISVFSPAPMGHKSTLGERRMPYNPQGLIYNPHINRNQNRFGKTIGKRPSQHKGAFISEYSNYPTSILEFASDTSGLHSTQKPLALLQYLIQTYTNEGDLVLDNTMGSGSTCIAAIREKRHYIGFELQPEYYEIAKKRIENEKSQLTLF